MLNLGVNVSKNLGIPILFPSFDLTFKSPVWDMQLVTAGKDMKRQDWPQAIHLGLDISRPPTDLCGISQDGDLKEKDKTHITQSYNTVLSKGG